MDALRNALLPVLAIAAALLLFGLFIFAVTGIEPMRTWTVLYQGAFGSSFAWQNTLQRAAPLMLTALCVAIPARAGLIIIGGEGALVLGGLAGAAAAALLPLPANLAGTVLLCAAGATAGAAWIMLAGALREYRGINETISSLLLAYIAIGLFKHLVEGPLRDPASLNKPSTPTLADGLRIGPIGSTDIHWGFVIGIVACLGLGLWLRYTARGFSVQVVGGNPRAARLVGLPTARLVLIACALGGACAGLAGAIEVAAVHTNANASLVAGYGYAGILVAFVARQNPFAIIPAAILFGGFGAAGSLLQRRLGLPDASVLVLQGIAFVLILASEALRQRDGSARFRSLGAHATKGAPGAAAVGPAAPDPTDGEPAGGAVAGAFPGLARRPARSRTPHLPSAPSAGPAPLGTPLGTPLGHPLAGSLTPRGDTP